MIYNILLFACRNNELPLWSMQASGSRSCSPAGSDGASKRQRTAPEDALAAAKDSVKRQAPSYSFGNLSCRHQLHQKRAVRRGSRSPSPHNSRSASPSRRPPRRDLEFTSSASRSSTSPNFGSYMDVDSQSWDTTWRASAATGDSRAAAEGARPAATSDWYSETSRSGNAVSDLLNLMHDLVEESVEPLIFEEPMEDESESQSHEGAATISQRSSTVFPEPATVKAERQLASDEVQRSPVAGSQEPSSDSSRQGGELPGGQSAQASVGSPPTVSIATIAAGVEASSSGSQTVDPATSITSLVTSPEAVGQESLGAATALPAPSEQPKAPSVSQAQQEEPPASQDPSIQAMALPRAPELQPQPSTGRSAAARQQSASCDRASCVPTDDKFSHALQLLHDALEDGNASKRHVQHANEDEDDQVDAVPSSHPDSSMEFQDDAEFNAWLYGGRRRHSPGRSSSIRRSTFSPRGRKRRGGSSPRRGVKQQPHGSDPPLVPAPKHVPSVRLGSPRRAAAPGRRSSRAGDPHRRHQWEEEEPPAPPAFAGRPPLFFNNTDTPGPGAYHYDDQVRHC